MNEKHVAWHVVRPYKERGQLDGWHCANHPGHKYLCESSGEPSGGSSWCTLWCSRESRSGESFVSPARDCYVGYTWLSSVRWVEWNDSTKHLLINAYLVYPVLAMTSSWLLLAAVMMVEVGIPWTSTEVVVYCYFEEASLGWANPDQSRAE